jgi:DNA topoisomerase-1
MNFKTFLRFDLFSFQQLSEASAAMKIKQVSVKAEPKADDDDHIPISQRMKKSFASDNKSSATKTNCFFCFQEKS